MAQKIKKVSLMYPNLRWSEWMNRTAWNLHPYNLGLIASMIEDKYDTSILDANMDDLSKEEFSKKIKETKLDVLGISIITNEYANSGLIAAELAKKSNPEIKTVIGGASAISNPRLLIENPCVDAVVIGEGEYAFRDLCNFFDGKEDLPKGVLYKENNKIIGEGRVDFIQDLDKLPLPAYHLVDFHKYSISTQRETTERPRELPYARVVTSRGCPFDCCFCEAGFIGGKKSRFRSLEKIAEEIEWLIRDYNIKSIVFDDDNFLTNKQRAKNLFKMMIDRNYNLKWNSPATAVFKMDDEMIDLMKQSGCQYLNIAIESGNKRVLKDIIHKPIRDLDEVKEIIKKIKKYDIDLAANFVVGFPGETWSEIRETFRYAEEIDIDYVRLYSAVPLPNTELYKVAKEQGCIKEDFEFDKHLWTDGWIETNEFRPQDLKFLRAYEWDRINFSTPEKIKKIAEMMGITEERLREIRKDTLKRANP